MKRQTQGASRETQGANTAAECNTGEVEAQARAPVYVLGTPSDASTPKLRGYAIKEAGDKEQEEPVICVLQ
jgi:hypothetical protein